MLIGMTLSSYCTSQYTLVTLQRLCFHLPGRQIDFYICSLGRSHARGLVRILIIINMYKEFYYGPNIDLSALYALTISVSIDHYLREILLLSAFYH